MANETRVLKLRRGDRAILNGWLRSRKLERRLVDRARIVLAAADGYSSRSIAATQHVSRATASLWIGRYEADGVEGIARDRPRSGRPRVIAADVEEAIVSKTTDELPPSEVATHGRLASWQRPRARAVR